MKKYSFIGLMAALVINQIAQAQDYIINWQNDTIACQLPGDIKKTGVKPAWKYEDGYESIVTVFNNDSVRIIKAGEIKGYTRKQHGKRLLCDGEFEAKQVAVTGSSKRTLVEEKGTDKNSVWYFFSRILEGKYANLYMRYESHGTCIYVIYYIQRHGVEETNTVIPIFSKKKLVELLGDNDIVGELKKFKYRKSGKGFSEIIKEYNRLKEAAAN